MAMYNEITVTAELTNTEYMITKNYNLLQNKPQINSVELMGNKSLEDLGINPDAEENVIDVVKVNGSALTPDEEKAVNVTVTTGTANGTVKVNGSDVAVKGLKSAAFTESTAYDAAGSAAEVQGNVDALTVVVNGKVDKVQGKGLSQNDFTNACKSKLDGIEAGAQVNAVTSVAGKTGAVTLQKSDVGLGNVDNTSDLNKPISTATQTALNGKVDKETGKGLSTNDYTTADKTKLAGIEEEANKTIVDSAISGVSTNPVQNKVIYDLINNLLPEKTASGNPISISDASGFKAKSAKVTMLPIQSGSGDPSPTNIRPISGRNSVDLVRTGKNLANMFTDGKVPSTSNGALVTAGGSRSDYIVVKPGTQYTFSTKNSQSIYMFYYDSNKAYISYFTNAATAITNNTPSNCKYVMLRTSVNANVLENTQFEEGTKTDYEPYNRQTYTATFPDTVYDGSYDFVSGEKTETKGNIIFYGSADENWTLQSINSYGIANFAMVGSNIKQNIDQSLCNMFVQQNSVIAQTQDEGFLIAGSNTIYLRIKSTTASTVEELRTWLSNNNVQIVYPFITPQETTLTPQSIALNKGINVITTDGDNIELKYSVSLDSLVSN